MLRIALASLVSAALVAIAVPSLGKRLPAPKTEICNRTDAKQYIATMSYAGRARTTTSGWTYIEPGACHTFRGDRYFVRGSGRVTGLTKKGAGRGCVKNTKRFDITLEGGAISDEQVCKEHEGYVVTFKPAKPDTRTRTKRVDIRPRKRAR